MEPVAILSHSFINQKGVIVPCRTAIIDLGIDQIDPGLTPDGSKCGESKVQRFSKQMQFIFKNFYFLDVCESKVRTDIGFT